MVFPYLWRPFPLRLPASEGMAGGNLLLVFLKIEVQMYVFYFDKQEIGAFFCVPSL